MGTRPRIQPGTLHRVYVPQSNVKVLVHTPHVEKHTLRINKAYLDYVAKWGFAPMVSTDKLLNKANQALYHIDNNQARKRFKNHLKLSKKLIGYEAYHGCNPETDKLRMFKSFDDLRRETIVDIGRGQCTIKAFSEEFYYDKGKAYIDKKKAAPVEVAA